MKSTWTLLILLTFIGKGLAQKTIQELATMPDKKFEKIMTEESYAGQVKTFAKAYTKQTGKDLPDPVPVPLKKVALLSFFTADFSQIDVKAYQRHQVFENYINEAGGQMLVNEFYGLSINELKTIFAANGMELLTPEEYLKTDAQKQVYNTYEVNISKLAAGATAIGGFFTKSNNKSLTPVDGYRVYPAPVVNFGQDMKVVRDLGKLANELDVDGFLTINTLTQLEKGEVGLKGISMSLHAPNPVPNDPEMKYGLGFYYEGILVGSIGFTLEKYMPFAKLPKKATAFENMDLTGFTPLMERMANQLLNTKKQHFGQQP
jgi:hypothetical protein